MHPANYCIYVFDSSTANEAARAVKDGHYESIIQYHSNKHQRMASKQIVQQSPLSPMPPQHMSPHMVSGPPHPPSSYTPTHHHVSPPNHMQSQQHGNPPQMSQQQAPQSSGQIQPNQQQPYDPSISPQRNRDTKLKMIGQLAQQLDPQPQLPSMASVPPTMHQMANANAPQRGAMPPVPQSQTPHQQQTQQQASPANQQQPQQPQQAQQTPPQHTKQEPKQHLDPLQSMAAMVDVSNMDNFVHTIHHHPPPN